MGLRLILTCLILFTFTFTFLTTNYLFAQESGGQDEIIIKAIGGLQYDKVRFKVTPGQEVTLTLINTDDMTHNLLLTTPGNRENIVSEALKMPEAEKHDYIPVSEDILAATPLLHPDESYTVTFTAPEKEGVYPYVCTYPGHGSVMYGAMYVTNSLLPPLANDKNIPEQRRVKDDEQTTNGSGHPYNMVLPSVYRAFMPNSGPASVAVGMISDISYCWDAGACRLRYVWKGGFVDMERTWSGKGKERADLVGVVFYSEEVDFPFRVGEIDHKPEVSFLGYKLKNRYPTFMYKLDGILVTERILPNLDRPGIKRSFTFENPGQDVWFMKPSGSGGVNFYSDRGTWEGNYLHLTPEASRSFTIYIEEESRARP